MLRTVVVSLTACLLLASPALAAEMSVGVADMQRIGIQCEANQAARNKYEAQFKAETTQLEKQKTDFDKKAKDFEAQRSKLDQKTFEQRVANLRKEAQQIADKEMAAQQKIGSIQNAINQDLADLAIAAAAEVAKTKNLDLILAHNTVMHAAQKLDVTADLLTEMDRIWKSQGSPIPGISADPAASSPAKPKN